MEAKQILDYCLSSLNGTVLVESWGEKGIFYNPGLVLKRGVYVLTVKEKDGDNAKGSDLSREKISAATFCATENLCHFIWRVPQGNLLHTNICSTIIHISSGKCFSR